MREIALVQDSSYLQNGLKGSYEYIKCLFESCFRKILKWCIEMGNTNLLVLLTWEKHMT